jgi:hypothetical protein
MTAAIAIGPAGPSRNLYIACSDQTIRRFGLAFQSVSAPLVATPNGLAGNPDDATFINLGAVGINLPLAGTNVPPSIGIAFGPDGNLYVSTTGSAAGLSPQGAIYVYGVDGTQLRSFATNGYWGIIRFGPDGLLYMLAYVHGDDFSSIERFDAVNGTPAGINGPGDSHVVPYGTQQLFLCSDMAVIPVGSHNCPGF